MTQRAPSTSHREASSPTSPNDKTAAKTPHHASHRYFKGMTIVGIVLMLIGGFGFANLLGADSSTASSVSPASMLAYGAILFAFGRMGGRLGAGAQVTNISFDLIARGRLLEAENYLDSLDSRTRTPLIDCVATIQRGLIAMRRGDAETGLRHLDQAIATKPGIFYRSSVRVQTVNALGIRAFLRAVTGDREGARADAKALRESPEALPQALARAALAEAICLEKEGDRDALRHHIDEHRDLLFDVTDRRERAIVRAFQRMLETTATSVYRKPAKLDLQGDDPPLVDWVAQLVPSAAPFVSTTSTKNVTNELPAAVASADAKKALANSRQTAEKQSSTFWTMPKRMVAIWLAMIAAFALIWQLFAPPTTPRQYTDEPWSPVPLLAATGGFLALTFAALIGDRVRKYLRGQRESRALFSALNLSAQGKVEAAREQFVLLTQSPYPLIKAQAHLALAQIAERRADLAVALDHCDKGIASLSQYVARISASDILLPDLMSQRAFVLAAMDRHDEAEAELEALPPAYPYKSRALLRVRLVSLVRRGDLDAAAKLAAETNLDLPLTARDELLADGVRAAVDPGSLGAGELPRIRRELRTVVSLRPWLETVAPAALVAIERTTDDVVPTPAENHDQAAEEEARAIDEAAREEALLRRANSNV